MVRYRILRVSWMFSFLFYLLVLIFVYTNLPEISRLPTLGEYGSDNFTKSTIFYLALGSFFLLNLLILFLVKLLDFRKKNPFYFSRGWIYGLGVTVNFFWTILVFYLLKYNNIQIGSRELPSFLLYIGPAIIVLWLVYLGINYKKIWYEWKP